jgi:hypothetical protein
MNLIPEKNRDLIVVDIQENNEDNIKFLLQEFIDILNSFNESIYYFYDGKKNKVDEDEDSILKWLNYFGEVTNYKINFIDKKSNIFLDFSEKFQNYELSIITRYMFSRGILNSNNLTKNDRIILSETVNESILDTKYKLRLDSGIITNIHECNSPYIIKSTKKIDDITVILDMFGKAYKTIE